MGRAYVVGGPAKWLCKTECQGLGFGKGFGIIFLYGSTVVSMTNEKCQRLSRLLLKRCKNLTDALWSQALDGWSAYCLQ